VKIKSNKERSAKQREALSHHAEKFVGESKARERSIWRGGEADKLKQSLRNKDRENWHLDVISCRSKAAGLLTIDHQKGGDASGHEQHQMARDPERSGAPDRRIDRWPGTPCLSGGSCSQRRSTISGGTVRAC
jgi:hypothetical protein